MKKTYVLDTNVLLSDTNSIFSFEENNVLVPMIVLEELDKHKSRQDEVGRNARTISRTLDELRSKGSLIKGVKLKNRGTLKVEMITDTNMSRLPVELMMSKVDNLIIAFMMEHKDHILVSKDINVRIKCDALGVKCEDYLKMRVATEESDLYTGVENVTVTYDDIEAFYENKGIEARSINREFYPNQIVVLKCLDAEKTTAIAKNVDGFLFPLRQFDEVFGLRPRNKEQQFALDLLFDDNIKLVTLTGPSGVGKNLLTLAAALEQLHGIGRSAKYDKLIVTRPIQPVGKDIGFLPGTLQEKMEPWIAPVKDNLNFLSGVTKSRRSRTGQEKPEKDNGMYLSMMQEKGLIEVEAISYIRGRSIPNAFMLLDECQNLNIHELKTIITRVGEGTKIVLLGDVNQIDNVHVDLFTNGLTYAVEKFKDQAIAGHVTLRKGERSLLATLGSQIL